jgi:hypothetical protein
VTRLRDPPEPNPVFERLSVVRSLIAAFLLATFTALLVAGPAAASCAPPAPVSENAGRAVAVVYGVVTSVEPGALVLQVDRVLKGQAPRSIRVFVGPGRPRVPGTAVATSVDYPGLGGPAAVASDHVLYLFHGPDGQLETNACSGSHPGAPDGAELAFFGIGRAADPGLPTAAPTAAPAFAIAVPDSVPAWLVPTVAIGVLVIAAFMWRRLIARSV